MKQTLNAACPTAQRLASSVENSQGPYKATLLGIWTPHRSTHGQSSLERRNTTYIFVIFEAECNILLPQRTRQEIILSWQYIFIRPDAMSFNNRNGCKRLFQIISFVTATCTSCAQLACLLSPTKGLCGPTEGFCMTQVTDNQGGREIIRKWVFSNYRISIWVCVYVCLSIINKQLWFLIPHVHFTRSVVVIKSKYFT